MPTPPEPAIARWFAHGVTSLTHPVLDYALETFLGPLGVEADWIEAEPFSALESGHGGWWLRNPRWNAARLDRLHPAAADFASLLEHPEWFQHRRRFPGNPLARGRGWRRAGGGGLHEGDRGRMDGDPALRPRGAAG